MRGVDQPDFGFITDTMTVQNRESFSITVSIIQPITAPSIAFIL